MHPAYATAVTLATPIPLRSIFRGYFKTKIPASLVKFPCNLGLDRRHAYSAS